MFKQEINQHYEVCTTDAREAFPINSIRVADEPDFCKRNLKKKSLVTSTEARKEGNIIYGKKVLRKAEIPRLLVMYSKSVAFAPHDTESLALAYGNRSAVLLRIKQYHNCILDVDKALMIPKASVGLKIKLLIRKAKCLMLLGNSEAEKFIQETRSFLEINFNKDESETKGKLLEELENVSKLDLKVDEEKKDVCELEIPMFEPSKEIPFLSDSVDLKYNKTWGRHLVASKNIKTGQVIAISEGYVNALRSDPTYYIGCSYCLKFTFSNFPCKHCAFAMYCSEHCEQKAWKQYHDIECDLIPLIASSSKYDFNAKKWLDLRIIIAALKEGGVEHFFKEVENVENNSDVRTKGFSDDGKLMSKKFRSIYSMSDKAATQVADEQDAINIIKMLSYHTNLISSINIFGHSEEYQQLKNIIKNVSKMNPCLVKNTFDTFCYCENGNHKDDFCLMYRGRFLSIFPTFLHHSCDPNVQKVFQDGKMIYYTLRPIKQNEQIFDSFGPTIILPKETRQHNRLIANDRPCECEACRNNWDTLTVPDSYYAMGNWLMNENDDELFEIWAEFKDYREDTNSFKSLCSFIDKAYARNSNRKAAASTYVLKEHFAAYFKKYFSADRLSFLKNFNE